jgi:crotonobetainyl-CoA:carnitine CoA-transferase CaiB-like acyl-CoA transferase
MSHLPMRGVRVVEVAHYTMTPSAGAVLADWGADVIKVEHTEGGDAQRGLRLGSLGVSVGSFQPMMEGPNRGKRSIGLDLKQPEALHVLHELIARADVFLVNLLPAARKRLKIDVDDMRAVNPQIIYVRGSAWGAKGPEAESGGFDLSVFWGRAGLAWGVTPFDSPRVLGMPAGAFGDSLGGLTMAGGVAAALFQRAQTGEPCELDVSLLGLGAWAASLSVNQALLTGEPHQGPSYGTPFNPLLAAYRTSDGRWILFIMVQPDRYWADLVEHLDRPDLATDARFSSIDALTANAAEATAILVEIIGARPFEYWTERFRTLQGQWSPVQNFLEVGMDPQLRANGGVRPVVDADGNQRELVLNPIVFDQTAPDITRAPQFAEHTDEILAELGHTDDEILDLKKAGAAR